MNTRTLKGLIHDHRIRATADWADRNPHMTDMPRGSSHWRVRLQKGRRSLSVPFSQGPAICSEPTADDVLDCLLSDASSADQTFEDWCSDYGYDTDSRSAERTYHVIQRQTRKLQQFFGDDFDAFIQAER